MSGLRERMKSRRRAAVLSAAEVLFHKKGFADTTIEEISLNAEVSIGTLYKYFNSKGGIILELVQPVIEQMRGRAKKVIDNPPENAELAIRSMYDAFEFDDDWKSHNLLQAFGPDYTGSDSQLLQISKDFEAMIFEQFTALLEKLIEGKKIRSEVDVEDAVYVLFQHMYSHFVAHISSQGDISYEQTLKNMHRRLTLILGRWSSS